MSEPAPSRARLWLVAKIVGAVVLLAAPIWGRAFAEGRAEVAAAEAARDQGELEDAAVHYGRAARWRTPLARHDELAVAQLLSMGDAAAAAGERDRALAAYREVRGALLATRVFGVPQRASFERANDAIAELMAEQEREYGTDVGGTGDPESFHRELLADVPGPNPVLSALASVLFVLFVLSVVGMFRYGLDEQTKPVPRHAVRFGVAIVVSLVGWLVLLRLS